MGFSIRQLIADYFGMIKRKMQNIIDTIKYAMRVRVPFILEDMQAANIAKNYSIGDKYKRIYFYHIRKTAGTSINHAFFKLFGDSTDVYERLNNKANHRLIVQDKILVGWNKQLIDQGNFYYGFSHIPMHDLNVKKDSFTFTLLREPVSRIISHYKMLREWVDNGVNHPSLKTERDFVGNNFGEFIQRVPREHLHNQLYMFSKNFDINEAVDKVLSLNTFFFVDNFDEGVENLSQMLKLKIESLHIRKSKPENVVKQEDQDLIYEKMLPEIEFINKLIKNI